MHRDLDAFTQMRGLNEDLQTAEAVCLPEGYTKAVSGLSHGMSRTSGDILDFYSGLTLASLKT